MSHSPKHGAILERICGSALCRKSVKLSWDLAIVGAAMLVAHGVLRPIAPLRPLDLMSSALLFIMNLLFGLHRQHYRAFCFQDLAAFVKALVLSFLLLGLVQQLPGMAELGGAPWLTVFLTYGGWGALRLVFRVHHDRHELIPGLGPGGSRRTLIVGGGSAGLKVAREIRRNRDLGMELVGFVDDDPRKLGLRIQGVPVQGVTAEIPELVVRHRIEQVVLAVPAAQGATLRRLHELARASGATVVTVPGLFRLLQGEVWRPVMKALSIEDLLRREPIQLDHSALGEQLRGMTVLVTGAGGSIGSEICRQVAPFGPERLILLGRGEGSLWTVERELRRSFQGLSINVELCDIRNQPRLEQVFRRWRPDVVFHAAAHKHVPYLEEHPEEAVENNVFGTQNVVSAALAVGTHTFVNISTDKAIHPTNVLGASKYLAERLVLMASRKAPAGHRYVSVRFGNVLGSRGSVIPIFQAQIEGGGPVTITHPDMKRYFMTIPEASQLVLQAGLLGDNGKVFVLDMGEPVRIVDLAEDMIRLAGMEPDQDIDIQFTGIRPGEKLFEEIFNGHEEECPGIHPKVREAFQKPLDPEVLQQAMGVLQGALTARVLTRRHTFLHTFLKLIPGYTPAHDGLGRYAEEPERLLA